MISNGRQLAPNQHRRSFLFMKWILHARIPLILLSVLLFSSCEDSNDPIDPADSVTGTWIALVTIQSCTPADVCDAIQLPTGPITATMQLSQVGERVTGTYSYASIALRADLTGLHQNQSLTLTGTAIAPPGQATVAVTGTVGFNSIQANIEHRIALIDGRTATATGTGTFVLQ
jgi:hypothetical protein